MTDPRSAKATLKTLAQSLGLSVTTVSRALRRGAEVHPDTIERVLKAADALGYARDRGALSLRTGQTFTVCYVMVAPSRRDLVDPSPIANLYGLQDGLGTSDYRLTAASVTDRDDPLEAIRHIVNGRGADGVIFDRTRPNDPRAAFLLDAGFPFVTFGRTGYGPAHAWIDIDDEDAARRETAALLDRGFRRPALINPPDTLNFALERRKGFAAALADAGLAPEDGVVAPTSMGIEDVGATVGALLDGARPPDSFVCISSFGVLSIHAALRARGLDPEAFGICVQDHAGLSRYLHPRPIGFGFPMREIGRRAMAMLLRRIEGADSADLQQLLAVREHGDDAKAWLETGAPSP